MDPTSLIRTQTGVETHAEAVVLAACALADTALPGRWSLDAVQDAATALEILADSLGALDPESAEILSVVPVAVAALLERAEQAEAGVPTSQESGGWAALSTVGVNGALRQALDAHGLSSFRVHQLGPALVTVTLEAADAQALAGLLTAGGEQREPPQVWRETAALWGAGPAGTAAAALGEALTAYGPGTYTRVLDSGHVSSGLSPRAAQKVTGVLTSRPVTMRRPRRRGLGRGAPDVASDR